MLVVDPEYLAPAVVKKLREPSGMEGLVKREAQKSRLRTQFCRLVRGSTDSKIVCAVETRDLGYPIELLQLVGNEDKCV